MCFPCDLRRHKGNVKKDTKGAKFCSTSLQMLQMLRAVRVLRVSGAYDWCKRRSTSASGVGTRNDYWHRDGKLCCCFKTERADKLEKRPRERDSKRWRARWTCKSQSTGRNRTDIDSTSDITAVSTSSVLVDDFSPKFQKLHNVTLWITMLLAAPLMRGKFDSKSFDFRC